METESGTRKSARNLPETLHSLLGLKSHLTSAWVKSVCNIVKNVPSERRSKSFWTKEPSVDEEDDSVSIDAQSTKDELSALAAYVNHLNVQRRQILNELLDLKGNIRVFCRVRPIRTVEGSGLTRPAVASDARNVIVSLTESKSKLFSFDRVFIPDSSQDEVFLEIEPVIKSVIDGYNACILAYGQTGTGKTFTMEGVAENPGIVPRAIRALFEQAEESNHAFLINFSMVEIYMGNLRDLLVPQATRPKDPIPPCLSIHTDAKGEIEIENLVAIKVNDFHHALKLYRLGCQNRATASTNSNSASSRSHCMIRVSVTCFGAPERRRDKNKVWLVDLGGSERVVKTRATGRRLDEGKAINLSLSALGDVIGALQRKKPHIPYRNSKLTQVLKDSLGQDSKTLMLVHISPKEDDLCETICSLNFASRAKNIHLGKDESTEERERKEAAMKNLQQEMEKIEGERQRALGDIRNLNLKLEKLTGKPPQRQEEEEEEAERVIAEEIQCKPEITKNKTGRVTNHLPSFMRPTFSSRRKLGRGQNINSNDSAATVRPRRPWRSTRTESVCFPVKKNDFGSICNSDRSISKSTCVMRLVDEDSATVYSQDISECEIKVVVSENKGQPLMCSGPTNPCLEVGNVEKNAGRRKDEHGISRVDNWLQSQTENGSYVHSKKRVTATPLPEKLSITKADKMSRETSENKFAYKIDGIEECKTEQTASKPIVMLKDLFELPCSCSSEPDDHVLSRAAVSDDNDDGDGESLCPSIKEHKGLSQYTDEEEDGEYILKEELSDRLIAEHSVTQFLPVQEDDYNADWERESSVSILVLEREAELKQFPAEQDSEVQLVKPMSQRALGLTDHIVTLNENTIPPLLTSQESLSLKGKARMVMEKAEALCFITMMGLGFMDFGYGSNFFYGLNEVKQRQRKRAIVYFRQNWDLCNSDMSESFMPENLKTCRNKNMFLLY